jgi:hypothetical protein
VGAFVLLVGVLTFIALDRIDESVTLEGRWELVVVETPEGSFHPEGGAEWIEFDGTYFTGHMDCVDFEGDFEVSGANGFILSGWGYSGGCLEIEGTGFAFENYFHFVEEIHPGTELVIQSSDATVQFIFTRQGGAAEGGVRAW